MNTSGLRKRQGYLGTSDAHSAISIEVSGNITRKYVTGVTVSNNGEGMITAIFGSGNHAGRFLRLTPEPTDGAISLLHHRQRSV